MNTKTDRAQTTIDFIAAVSIFVVVVGAVFVYIPGLFAPFTDKSGTTVASNRAADTLSERMLSDNADARVKLDTQCTVAFFDMIQNGGSTSYDISDCQYQTHSTVREAVGLGIEYRVNARIVDDSGAAITKDGVLLEAGQTPTQNVDVVVAQRTVQIDNERYTLRVSVW